MSGKIAEKVIVRLLSEQECGGESSNVELVSEGTFKKLNGGFEISYDENADTGYENSRTRLTVTDNRYVIMEREGDVSGKLILENGVTHICHYGTPFGIMEISVSAQGIKAYTDEKGAFLEFKYSIDFGGGFTGNYKVTVNAARE